MRLSSGSESPSGGSGPHPGPRFGGVECIECGEVRPREELDPGGWCETCEAAIARRSRWRNHVIAAGITIPFAVWIWTLDRGVALPWYAWLIPLGAAYYLGLRIGREVNRGYRRWRRQA